MKRVLWLASILIVAFLGFLTPSWGPLRSSTVALAQNGTIVLNVTTYASYKYNVLKHPTGLFVVVGVGGYPSNAVKYEQILIVDSDNNLIRSFTPGGGTLQVFAGTGSSGSSDGTVCSAQFNRPTGILWTGSTYFTPPRGPAWVTSSTFVVNDSQNFKVRQIYQSTSQSACGGTNERGVVTTPYGTGAPGYVDGSASVAQFRRTSGLANGLLIADTENHVIRSASGNTVTTVAGSGISGFWNAQGKNAEFSYPTKVSQGSGSGEVYISDTGNHAIRKLDVNGNVTTVAGGPDQGYVDGPTSSAKFRMPTGSIWYKNALYVVDTGNNVIRKIDLQTNIVSTFAGSGPAGGLADGPLLSAKFNAPTDIALTFDGFFVVSDTMNNAIRRIDINAGQVLTYIY